MSSRRRNTNTGPQTSTRIRRVERRWSPDEEKTLLNLYDEALGMNQYRFKDPGQPGRAFIVRKFNEIYGESLVWETMKNKIDQWKKEFKLWKQLQRYTGISVDNITGKIMADDGWWNDREQEFNKLARLNREPPKDWDTKSRCFAVLDVGSQRQYSVQQRRAEIRNEQSHDGDNDDGSEPNEVPETQQNEEVYHVNIYDDSQPSYEFSREATESQSPVQVPDRSGRQHSRAEPSSSRRIGARGPSGTRAPRRRQNFESTIQQTMSSIRDFQRETYERLRPGAFDREDYTEFEKAVEILESLSIPRYNDFYIQCLQLLKTDLFWRNYWMSSTRFQTNEDRILLMESLTGFTRHGEHIGTTRPPSGSSTPRSSDPSSAGSMSTYTSQRTPSISIDPPTTGFRQFLAPINVEQRASPRSQVGSPGLGFTRYTPRPRVGSPSLGFLNNSPTGQMFQTPGAVGLFNTFGQNNASTSQPFPRQNLFDNDMSENDEE